MTMMGTRTQMEQFLLESSSARSKNPRKSRTTTLGPEENLLTNYVKKVLNFQTVTFLFNAHLFLHKISNI